MRRTLLPMPLLSVLTLVLAFTLILPITLVFNGTSGVVSAEPSEFHRVVVFIDGPNLHRSCQRFRPDYRLDLPSLVRRLTIHREYIRSYVFGSLEPDDHLKEKALAHNLRSNGFEVHIRSPALMEVRDGRSQRREKGVDTALVTKMLAFGFRDVFDDLVLVSGDADFVEALQEVKDLGKRVEVVAFRNSLSEDLKNVADQVVWLDDLADIVEVASS